MAELGHQYGGEDKVQWNLGQVRGKRQRTSYEIMLSRLHCGFNLNSSVHIYLFVSAALKRYHLSLSEKEKRRQKGVDESHTQSMRRQGRCRHVSSTFTIGLTTSPPDQPPHPLHWDHSLCHIGQTYAVHVWLKIKYGKVSFTCVAWACGYADLNVQILNHNIRLTCSPDITRGTCKCMYDAFNCTVTLNLQAQTSP